MTQYSSFNSKPSTVFSWRRQALSACALLGLALFGACGPPKTPNNIAILKEPEPSGAAGVSASGGGSSNMVSIFEQAYGQFADEHGKMTQVQLTNVLKRFGRDSIDTGLLSMVYDQTPGKNENLSLQEIRLRVPTLIWQSPSGEPLAFSELDVKLFGTFPASTPPARDALAAVLRRYDFQWAGGNADQRLSQGELLTAGVILGWSRRADFTKGVPVLHSCADNSAGAVGGLSTLSNLLCRSGSAQLAQTKVAQQVFANYAANAATLLNLSADDTQLEWSQLVLKLILVGQQVKGFNGASVAAEDLPAFLKEWKIDDYGDVVAQWAKCASLYSQKRIFNGDSSGKLDQLQAFNFVSDALFAQGIYAAFENSVTPASAAKHLDKAVALARIYPKTGAAVVLDSVGKPSDDFWKSLGGDGAVGLPGILFGLDALSLTEIIFVNHDANQDLKLQKTEAQAALTALGMAAEKQDMALLVLFGLSTALTPSQFFASTQQMILQLENKAQ